MVSRHAGSGAAAELIGSKAGQPNGQWAGRGGQHAGHPVGRSGATAWNRSAWVLARRSL